MSLTSAHNDRARGLDLAERDRRDAGGVDVEQPAQRDVRGVLVVAQPLERGERRRITGAHRVLERADGGGVPLVRLAATSPLVLPADGQILGDRRSGGAEPARVPHQRLAAELGQADPADPQKNPLNAAMVKSMDEAVGRLLRHIEESGEADNTLIVFWSDNGGYAYPPKTTDPEGYTEIPATSNLPFRSGKASLYEGGTREPGIVVWPGKVKPGTTADFLMQSTDIYPTILAACGVAPQSDQKVDGFDQTTALTGGSSPRTQIFCHFPHGDAQRGAVMDGFYAGSSIREGDLKLIRFYARADDGSDELELYNLAQDPGERHNLATERPEIASRLNKLLQRQLADNKAIIPKLNPDFEKP
jgi:arylsulfatase A-like enzyme